MKLSVIQKCLALMAGTFLLIPALACEAEARHHASSTHRSTYRSSASRHHSHGKNHRGRRVHHVGAQPQQLPEIGAIVMTERGEVIYDHLSGNQFNPASVAKIVTAYAAIKTFGLNYQFSTVVSQQGELNPETGILKGNLYVQGFDPDFDCNDAGALREALHAAGVKQVDGKLIVSKDFSYGSVGSAAWSARKLQHALAAKGEIRVKQGCAIGATPTGATPLVEQHSEPLRRTLKEMLSYSQNQVAEQIGHCTGGVAKVREIVSLQSSLTPSDLQIATASGLGRNRMKPKDMMQVLVAFRGELQRNCLDLQDLLPVAGVDGGTLDERFVEDAERGSVVGKTGTLPGTDGGSSALAGMCNSQTEKLYFVIFCWRGNVATFRHVQDDFIRKLQAQRGGPRAFDYYSPAEVSRLPANNSSLFAARR